MTTADSETKVGHDPAHGSGKNHLALPAQGCCAKIGERFIVLGDAAADRTCLNPRYT